MEELIGAVFRTFAGLLLVQSMFTKTESEGTNKILRYLWMLIAAIIAICLLVAWMK